mgnify:CR=1 FL=1
MAVKMTITRIHAREILDSRGNPTIETEVTVETETTGKLGINHSLVVINPTFGKPIAASAVLITP